MNRFFGFVTYLSLILAVPNAHAYSAVAAVPGYVHDSLSWNSGASQQKLADKGAIETCRKSIANAGHAKLAAKCKVITRAKGPGYGAVVCGDKGCAWTTGYGDKQVAVDSAWKDCDKAGYGNCQESNIQTWYDDNWPIKPTGATLPNSSCRPNTPSIRCQSNCVNGNCVVTYENGCKLRVQVAPKFNPFNNQWEYPSPSC